MRNNLWVITILVASLTSFFVGYSVSKETGVEPGFFEAVETGSYGGGGSEGTEGVSSEDEKYYQDLTKE